MVFWVFKDTIIKNRSWRVFCLVRSLCNVCDHFTWPLMKSAMFNTSVRVFASPNHRDSVSLSIGICQVPQNGNFFLIVTVGYLWSFNLVEAGPELDVNQ